MGANKFEWDGDAPMISDATLSYEILGYEAMSKSEHTLHTRDILSALRELRQRRAASTPPTGAPQDER